MIKENSAGNAVRRTLYAGLSTAMLLGGMGSAVGMASVSAAETSGSEEPILAEAASATDTDVPIDLDVYGASLKDLYQDYFRMGVSCEAISHWDNTLSEIGNPAKEALITYEFNSITFGNELKPAYNMGVHSADAREDYLPFEIDPAALEMLTFAKANGLPVRGHVLIWHSQCADEVFCKDYTPVYLDGSSKLDPSCFVSAEILDKRMQSYIYNVFEYMYENGFADVIYAWDVVNEAVEPGDNADNLRNSYWYQILGSDYIYNAFRYAREAEESLSAKYAAAYAEADGIRIEEARVLIQPKLFYNDYNEFQLVKRDAILKVTAPIKEAGYIDGIGMQAHLSDSTDIDSFITAMKMYDEAIGEVQVTELDVTRTGSGVNADYYQAAFYNRLFRAMRDAVEEGVNLTGVTLWGLTDDNSWKKESCPLIFNGDLTPKSAFDGIVAAATGEEIAGPENEVSDRKDIREDFSGATNIASPRGIGHMPVCTVIDSEDGTGKVYAVSREEPEASMKFDVSKFIGATIQASAMVKTADATITMGFDAAEPVALVTVDSVDGSYTEVTAEYTIPDTLTSACMYIETSGSADFFVDSISVKIADYRDDVEGDLHFKTRWGGAGTVSIAEEADGNHAALLTGREENYYGMAFDVTPYLGMLVEISFDVKTDDSEVKLSGDIDQVWPNYLVAPVTPGVYNHISGLVQLPDDLTALNLYIEADGTTDIYVDNLLIHRVEEE